MTDVVERRPIEARLTILANVMAANPIALHTREVKAEAQAAITEAAREIEALRKNETELRDSMNALLDERALSQAGAGGGVVVTNEMVNAAWNEGKRRRVTGSTYDFRAVLEVALAALAASPSAGEPVAWIKRWMNDNGTLCERVDLTSENEPWLRQFHPKVTPLYATPPTPVQTASVEAVRDAWSFLQDRLLEFEQEIGSGEEEREWAGHVMPALSRFGSIITSLTTPTQGDGTTAKPTS